MPVHLNSWGLEFVWWCAGTEIVFKQNAQYIYFNSAHLWKIGKLVMCTMCTSHIWDAVILWKTTNMRCSRLRALWVVTNPNITVRRWQCPKWDSFSTWVGEQRWKDPLKNGMQKIIGFGTWDSFLYMYAGKWRRKDSLSETSTCPTQKFGLWDLLWLQWQTFICFFGL